jgi:hypothetical protein
MFHLEDKCLKQLTFLLILGGQVELNPGPRAETLYPPFHDYMASMYLKVKTGEIQHCRASLQLKFGGGRL